MFAGLTLYNIATTSNLTSESFVRDNGERKMRVMAENPMGRQRSGWRYKLYRAGRGIQRNWGLYLLLLPAVVLLFCFTYLPMYGVQIAFKDFSPSQGIQGSPWVGLANFQKFFNSFQSKNLIWNTVSLSLYSLVAGFPFPIILALMVNQIRVKRFKQVLQVVTYLPHLFPQWLWWA